MFCHTVQVVIAPPIRSPKPRKTEIERSAQRVHDTFIAAMLELPCEYQRRNPLEWIVSLVVHGFVIAGLIIAPLYFTQTLDLKAFQNTWLVTPAPPRLPRLQRQR